VIAVWNYLWAAAWRFSPGRYFWFDRKWALDSCTNEPTELFIAIRHWQTVKTVDHSLFIDYPTAIVLAVGRLVIMYLCYRCGLVRQTPQPANSI